MMMGSIPIALSGLMASADRLAASASNIANLRTTGRVPVFSAAGFCDLTLGKRAGFLNHLIEGYFFVCRHRDAREEPEPVP